MSTPNNIYKILWIEVRKKIRDNARTRIYFKAWEKMADELFVKLQVQYERNQFRLIEKTRILMYNITLTRE